MRDVAAFKWLHELPVTDLDREQLVINAAVSDGLRRGLRPQSSGRFFQAQIEAAKDIQNYWFERWAKEGGPTRAPDLTTHVRPSLLRLGTTIIEQSATTGLRPSAELFASTVVVEGLSERRRTELFDSLTGIQTFSSRLEQVLETGLLRVASTGDYAPFSYSEDGSRFEGIDIELARDLAVALGVELQLVQTSWPTLLTDLSAGRYDIAMSGVSRTMARAKVGYLSAPYYVGGKTPIARCEDKEKFATLADIDRPGVRIIVNPGGTNEAFVDTRIDQAEKILHTDNRSIFAALSAGIGDVMITDRIEVTLQTQANDQLCATMAELLTYQEKGYLMPRDESLRSFVDTWLALRLGDGTVEGLLEKHLRVEKHEAL